MKKSASVIDGKNTGLFKVGKSTPSKHTRRGKPLISMADYAKQSQVHIAELERKMAAINDKKNPLWSKYRMQKIAYEARLRNRQKR